MTAKEKAKKLVKMFLEHFYGFGIDQDVREEEAKKCAIEAVDEILKLFSNHPQNSMSVRYWQDVKDKINKL